MVDPLLRSKNPLLASAAEGYLLAEDSKEARELLWKRHPKEAFIAGWRPEGRSLSANSQLAKMEGRLRAELFKENGPIEIIALVTDYDESSRVLRIYSDRAVQTDYEDASRYRERTISKAELASFKQFIITSGLPDLGAQFAWCHHDCWSGEFLTLTKDKGKRVFTLQGAGSWSELNQNFDQLANGEGAKIHYNLEKELKGLEVLYADEQSLVRDVWQKGGEIRLLIERQETDEELEQRVKAEEAVAQDDEISYLEGRLREATWQQAQFSWRVLANDKLGAVTSQPEIYSPVLDNKDFPPASEEDDPISYAEDRQVQRINSDSIVIAQGSDGLWKQSVGTKPVRIGSESGSYSTPIVTPDGKWIVVAKTDDDASTDYIVRFNLRSGREFRVNLEPAGEFEPVAFVAAHNKVLLRRAKENRSEYYLLDAATGETKLVTGEFTPLYQLGKRFLQATGKPNEFWVAIPDEAKNQTQVGHYNLKDFSFKQVMLIPHISFDSMSMWVDAGHAKIYLVYKDQLLRLPLQAAPENR